jgi:TolB-like protein
MQPSADEIKAALGRILSSAGFGLAGRSSAFLRFVVEESFAGRGNRLKGYSIARAVFGKPADFDAQSDPLVRVEAGRLRRRLAAYYSSEGRYEPFRIELPRGSYAPVFEPRPASLVETRLDPDRRQRRWRIAALASAALAAGTLLVLWTVWPRPEMAEQPAKEGTTRAERAARMPGVLVVPFDNLGDRGFDYFAFGLTEEVIVGLSTFDLFVIANRAGYQGRPEPIAAVTTEVGADYVLTGSVRHDDDRIRVLARLMDARDGEQIWVGIYDEALALDALLAVQERIAREVATALGEPLGPLYDQEFARSLARAPADLDTYDCVLRFYYYAQMLDRQSHRTTVDCLQRTLGRDPDNALAWGALAILFRHEYLYDYNPRTDEPPALARALEAARRSLDIDGKSAMGTFALALVRQTSGDIAGFEAGADRLLMTGLLPPTGLIQIGSSLIFAGDRDRGRAIVDAAIEQAPRPPGWSYLAYVVYYLQSDDYAEALRWAKRVDMPQWFGDPMFAAATAALAGNRQLAERSAARLLALFPEFPSVGRTLLRRWAFDEAVYSRLIAGLEAAGVELE